MKLFLLSLLAIIVNAQNSGFNIDYSDKDARLLLRLSASAYAADPRICLKRLMPANESWSIINSKEVPCDTEDNVCAVVVMISDVKKEIIIAYRGDFGDKQFQQEAEEWMGPDVNWYGYGSVGQLFVAALNKTWVAVQPTLMNPSTKDYKVTFTGYSLGGSIAGLSSMLAFNDKLRQPEKIRVITFGEPRFGDEQFAANYDRIIQNSYRVVHKADIVPHMVACNNKTRRVCDSNVHLRRTHHATEVWYNNDMSEDSGFVICSKDDEDINCSNSLGSDYNTEDHKFYFGRVVSAYGLNDCQDTHPSGSSSKFVALHLCTYAVAMITASISYSFF